ncbi:hypothetical protein DQG13_17510 [Paenibacillus sp. YN15]|nr:hypothetical protein DQG13_17510 [Paenibacillus sp. YN15]
MKEQEEGNPKFFPLPVRNFLYLFAPSEMNSLIRILREHLIRSRMIENERYLFLSSELYLLQPELEVLIQ